MVDQIWKELETGKLAEAELQISSLLKSDPENPEALTLKGILLFKSGRFELALEYFRNVLIKQPYQVEALCGQARVQHTLGRPQEAVSCLLKSLEKQRDDPEVFNLLGICLLALGRAAEAANAFMCSISLNSEVAATHANLGMSLRLQNQGVEAVISFKKAVELDPTEPQNFLQLFKQLQQLSRWDEAVDVLKRGMYQHPSSISLAEALALTYGRLNRGQEAEAIFMRISEQSALAANQYATWLQEQGRFEDSVAVLHQSLKLQPVQGVAYRGLVEARQACVEDNAILDVAVQLLESSQLSSVERMHLYYAMGKIYDGEEIQGGSGSVRFCQ